MTNNTISARSTKTHLLVESAIMIALSTVLSLIKVYEAPFGGSVTLLSMAPMIILSLRHGMKTGFAASFVYAILQLVLGIGSVAWVPTAGGIVLCILFDYLLPFTGLGFGGLFRGLFHITGTNKQRLVSLITAALLGTAVAVLFRFLCHIVSGAVIWYALDLEWYADDPTHIVHQYGAWMFSLVYNGTYMIPEIIETLIGVPLLTAALAKFRVK